MRSQTPRLRRAGTALAAVAAAVALLVPAAPAAAEVPPEDLVVDLTFPAEPGGRYSDDYLHARGGGRTHCGTDILGPKHSELYATVSGVIEFMPMTKPSYGYMINLRGDDGRKYSYVHLNDDTPGTADNAAGPEHAYAPGLAKGSRVVRGQLLGYMGDSGNATGTPHLHFEIHDVQYEVPACKVGGSNRINPYDSLRAAEAERDYGASSSGGAPEDPPPAHGTARAIDDACPEGQVPPSGFTDVGPTHAPGVECVAWWDVVAGTSATTFSPGATITRAQLATFVANFAAAMDAPLPAATTDHFDDDEGSVHEDNINRVASAGIMGSTSRSFSPNLAVTRGSMATVVARSYKYRAWQLLPPGPDAFSDDDGNPNEGNIDDVAFNGIAIGYDDGTFRPLLPVTREQMATFFARLLDILVEHGHGSPPA